MTVRSRPTSSQASQILEELARRNKRTIRLPDDADWLHQITPHPVRLLSRMSASRVLYRITRGRYAVAPPGTSDVEQAVSAELIADIVFSRYGPYYIGFLTALIDHRLTDLHSQTIYVAVPKASTFRGDRTHQAFVSQFKVARLSRWPDESDLERYRVFSDAKEFVWRSSVARTLVDGLTRPDLCAGFETVVSSWGRASRSRDVNWAEVAACAQRFGPNAARRTAYIFKLLDMSSLAVASLGSLKGRTGNLLLDKTNGFSMDRDESHRDSTTGVTVNVPLDHLRGWLEGAGFA